MASRSGSPLEARQVRHAQAVLWALSYCLTAYSHLRVGAGCALMYILRASGCGLRIAGRWRAASARSSAVRGWLQGEPGLSGLALEMRKAGKTAERSRRAAKASGPELTPKRRQGRQKCLKRVNMRAQEAAEVQDDSCVPIAGLVVCRYRWLKDCAKATKGAKVSLTLLAPAAAHLSQAIGPDRAQSVNCARPALWPAPPPYAGLWQ